MKQTRKYANIRVQQTLFCKQTRNNAKQKYVFPRGKARYYVFIRRYNEKTNT